MKNLKFFSTPFIIMIMLAFSTFSYSASIKSMAIKPVKNEKQILLTIETSGSGLVQINIRNSANKIVFNQTHESLNSFVKKMNLQSFKSGSYTLEIEDDYVVNTKPFIVTDNGVEISEENASEQYKPIVRWDSKTARLDVDWLLNAPENIDFILRNDYNDLVHQNRFRKTNLIRQRFNLTMLNEGNYTALIKTKTRSYSYPIEVK